MSNNSSTASRVAAHNSKGVPYTGWIEGVGYQHLRNRPIVNCYFRDGGVSLPNFEPVIDTSPKMRVASVGGKYRVEQGENLSIIARRFGTTPDAIMAANPSIDWAVARKKGNLIYAGELLEIPPVFEEANAQNRPVPRAQVVDAKSFYGDKGRGGGQRTERPSDGLYGYIDCMVTKSFEMGNGKISTPIIGYSWNTLRSGSIDPSSTYATIDFGSVEFRGYPFKGGISGEDATVRALVTLYKRRWDAGLFQFSGKVQLDMGMSIDSAPFYGFRLNGSAGYTSFKGAKTGVVVNVGFKLNEAPPIPEPDVAKWSTILSGGAF